MAVYHHGVVQHTWIKLGFEKKGIKGGSSFLLHFFFSHGGVASDFPHCVCPLLPLLLPGIIVACLHAMVRLNFIISDNLFEKLILTPTYDLVVKNAASKNQLYLSVKVWNGFWSRTLNLFFNAAKALSMVTLRFECLRLNNSFTF